MAQQGDTALPVIDKNNMANNRENYLLEGWYKLNLKEARDLQQAQDNHLLEKSRREKALRDEHQDQDNEYGPSDIDDLGREIIAAARKKEEEDLAEELVTEPGNELFWVRKGFVEPKKEIIQKINDEQLQERVYDLEQELFKAREDIQMKDTRIYHLEEDAQRKEEEIAKQDKGIQGLKREKEKLKLQLSHRDFISLSKHGQDNAYRNAVQLYKNALQHVEMLENKTHNWDKKKMTLDRSLKATAQDLDNANKEISKLKQELCIKEPLVRAARDFRLAWREVIKRLVGLPYDNALIIKGNRIRHGGNYEADAALRDLGIYCTSEHRKWFADTYGIVPEPILKDILDLVNMRGTVKACGFGTDQSLCSDEDEKTFNEHFDNAIDHYQRIKNMKLSKSEGRKIWHDNTAVAKGMQKMKEIEEKVSRLERRRNPNVTTY